MKPEQIAAIAVIILILYFIYRLCLSKRNSGSFLPYRKKLLLTKRYGIIAKVRLADLIEVDTDKTKEFGRFFPKISSKHIDFALINPDNMEVLFLIELDDRSHDLPARKERDDFVNKVCEKTGYHLIRTYGDTEEIKDILQRNRLTY